MATVADAPAGWCRVAKAFAAMPIHRQRRSGMTALFAAPAVSPEQKQQTAALMAAVSATGWLDDENLMDAAWLRGVGSEPAYIFMAEAMVNCGETLGLAARRRQLASGNPYRGCRHA